MTQASPVTPPRASTVVEDVSCDLCGADNARTDAVVRDWTYVRCRRCDLVYLNPRPVARELERVYAGLLYADGMPTLEPARRDLETPFYGALLDRVERLVPPGRLFEIGCSMGAFLTTAMARGWDVRGVDLGARAVSVARESLGDRVALGSVFDLREPEASYDAVAMFATIEHVPNPVAHLREMHRLLRPDGIGVITTGEVDTTEAALFRRLAGVRDLSFWYSPVEHLYCFSRATLRRAAERAGFHVVELSSEFDRELRLAGLALPAPALIRRSANTAKAAVKAAVRRMGASVRPNEYLSTLLVRRRA